MFHTPAHDSPTKLTIKIVFLLVCLMFSFQILFSETGSIVLDFLNVMIHEAGHIVFMFFGRFFYVLGGTLLQLLVPYTLITYCFILDHYFALGISLFWMGNNMCHVGRYMADSRSMQEALFGKHHDWSYLFSAMGIIEYDRIIGNIFYGIGIVLIFAGLVMMYTLILLQFKHRFVRTIHTSSV